MSVKPPRPNPYDSGTHKLWDYWDKIGAVLIYVCKLDKYVFQVQVDGADKSEVH